MIQKPNTDICAIPVGQPFTLPFQFSLNPGLQILSASNASPIVITTTAAHNLSSGNEVFISGCGNTGANSTDAVPSWVIAKIDATSFSLTGSTTVGAGGQVGVVSKVTDFSGYTGACQFRKGPEAAIYTDIILTATFTWISQTKGRAKITLSTAQTLTLGSTVQLLYGQIVVSNGTQISVASFTSPILVQTTTTFNP